MVRTFISALPKFSFQVLQQENYLRFSSKIYSKSKPANLRWGSSGPAVHHDTVSPAAMTRPQCESICSEMQLFLLLYILILAVGSLPEADDQWGPDVAAVVFPNSLSVCGVESCAPKR